MGRRKKRTADRSATLGKDELPGATPRVRIAFALHRALYRLVYAIETAGPPEGEPEHELLQGLRPLLVRYEERINNLLGQAPGGAFVNAAFTVFCPEHEKPYKDRGANMTAAMNAITHRFMEPFFKQAKGKEDLAKALRDMAEVGKPICCTLTQEVRDELLALAIPSTGDEAQDMKEAIEAVPEVQPLDEPMRH